MHFSWTLAFSFFPQDIVDALLIEQFEICVLYMTWGYYYYYYYTPDPKDGGYTGLPLSVCLSVHSKRPFFSAATS